MMPVDRYFIRREVESGCDHEESYWVNVVDPDDTVRDLTEESERARYLEDIRQELGFIKSLTPGRVLDVGCGLGFLLSALDDGWEKHGVEVSAFAADHARGVASVYLGPLENAEYPSESFDLVVMHHVIEHIPDPVRTILEVHRILKGGGSLLLATPDFDSGCARRFGGNYRLLHDSTHISLFSNESMLRFLRDFGFVIDRVEYPFFETRHFSKENLERLFNIDQISPPFHGNFMTFYCHKPCGGAAYLSYSHRWSSLSDRAEKNAADIDILARRCVATVENGQTLWLDCGSENSWFAEWLRECGLPIVQAALLAKEESPTNVSTPDSNRFLVAGGPPCRKGCFAADDMILVLTPDVFEPEHVAELKNLQAESGVVIGALTAGENPSTSAVGFDVMMMGPVDADPEGVEIMVAISALAARCRELIDGI